MLFAVFIPGFVFDPVYCGQHAFLIAGLLAVRALSTPGVSKYSKRLYENLDSNSNTN
jgi:hypothetical protein